MRDGIAEITLNRPDAANAIDMRLGRELMEVAIRCDEDAEIRSVLLTGAGHRFCAGGHLKAFATYADELPGAMKGNPRHYPVKALSPPK